MMRLAACESGIQGFTVDRYQGNEHSKSRYIAGTVIRVIRQQASTWNATEEAILLHTHVQAGAKA